MPIHKQHINQINNPTKTICFITLILFWVLLFPNVSYAGDSLAWIARYISPGGGDDTPVGVFIDSSGKKIYVVGSTEGVNTPSDIFLVKFDSLGQQQWVSTYNGPGNSDDIAVATIMDTSGNIYIACRTMTPEKYETRAFVLLKYNSTGQQLWVKTYEGSPDFPDIMHSINLDDSGNVYVCGVSYTSVNSPGICIIKYKPNGDREWIRSYTPSGYDEFWFVDFHVLEEGVIYLALTAEHPQRGGDWVIAKLSSQGTVQWEKVYKDTGSTSENLNCSRIDDRGNIYLTGTIIKESENSDFCTMKIDSLGNIKWISQYNGPENLRDEAYNLDIDNEGNIYVAGMSVIREIGEEWAIRLIKYDSLGRQRWVNTYSHPNGTYELGSMNIKDDSIYVTGTATPASFDSLSYITVVKYDTSGNQMWVKNYKDTGESAYNDGFSVEFDKRGNMYVFGICGTNNDNVFLMKYWGR